MTSDRVSTYIQTDTSEDIIINKSPLLLFFIQVDLKLQDLLSKTNCTSFKVKRLYERIIEELYEIDKSYLTIQETNVMKNLQDLKSICQENSKDIVKVISGYYSGMNEQSMSTISCVGNLSEQTKYFTDLLTSFLALSSSFQKQTWFSDVFLDSSWEWEPISYQADGINPRKAISLENNLVPINVEDEDIESQNKLSLDLFDRRNTFSNDPISEVEWKNHIERLKRTSQSMEIVEIKFFILRSRDIHFMQTLSNFDVSE